MSDIGAMVAELIEAGCAPDVAAKVVSSVFVTGVNSAIFRGIPPDSAMEKRRAYDRERKRKSTGIPPESTGIPKRALVEEYNNKKVSKRGSRIPPEWKPSPEDHAFAKRLGWSDAQIESEAANFRDYWIAKPGVGGLKLDWPATWRKWIRDSKIKPASPPPNAPASSSEIDWRPILQVYKRFGAWSKHAPGSEPGTLGCVVPKEILAEFGYASRDGPAVEIPKLKAI